MKINKVHAIQQLAAEEGALRYTIMPPGGDTPGADKITVKWVEMWRNEEDYAAHKRTPHLAENGPKMGALSTLIHIVEFNASYIYEKISL